MKSGLTLWIWLLVITTNAMLQCTGRRALVVLPNDPDLVDILAKNGVDISVSEGEQQGNYVALLGNLLFPLIAFGGLFFLFRGAGGQVSALCRAVVDLVEVLHRPPCVWLACLFGNDASHGSGPQRVILQQSV